MFITYFLSRILRLSRKLVNRGAFHLLPKRQFRECIECESVVPTVSFVLEAFYISLNKIIDILSLLYILKTFYLSLNNNLFIFFFLCVYLKAFYLSSQSLLFVC